MNLFDRVVVATLPLVPKVIVGKVASQYIAGESLADAVRTVKSLNQSKFLATVDVLGEFVYDEDKAAAAAEEYVRLLDVMAKDKLQANVSVKLTAMGLSISSEVCRHNFGKVLDAAKKHGTFIRIDMEDSPYTDKTLGLYDELRKEHDIGVVIQAYLRRSLDDISRLMKGGAANFRLCKGIYNESESIAFKDRQEIRDSFMRLLEYMLAGGAKVGIATHDEWLVDRACELISRLGIDQDRYEFQMLLGVRPELRDQIQASAHRVRIYVPYGESWYGYSTRRLKENPQIAGYVFKGLFKK